MSHREYSLLRSIIGSFKIVRASENREARTISNYQYLEKTMTHHYSDDPNAHTSTLNQINPFSAFRMGPTPSGRGLCDIDRALFRVTKPRKLESPGSAKICR